MSEQPALDTAAIKHLEFLQAVIARLSGNAFVIKGWSLTLAAAFFGFSTKDLDGRLAAVGLLPVIVFWGLDAYFLSRERSYRQLYDAVRVGDSKVSPFSMDYRAFLGSGRWYHCGAHRTTWWCSVWSRSLWLFYGAIIAAGVVLIVVTSHHV
jgi:hypothetical protein